MDRAFIFELINQERRRQDEKWGRRPGYWPASQDRKLAVLVEEVGEVAEAILTDSKGKPAQDIRMELVQVAAVAVAWLETLPVKEDDEPI